MPQDRIGKTRQTGLHPLSTSPRGVLHRVPVGEFEHQRLAPPEDLADWIEHIWRVRWNLEGLPPQLQETLPHPNIHLVLEPGMAALWGVHSRRWSRELSGRSLALGIKFRPGAFRPWLGGPVSALSDRSLALQELFGPEVQALNAALEIDALAEAATPVLDFLRARLPAPDPQALLRRPHRRQRGRRPESAQCGSAGRALEFMSSFAAAPVCGVRRRRAEMGDSTIPHARSCGPRAGREKPSPGRRWRRTWVSLTKRISAPPFGAWSGRRPAATPRPSPRSVPAQRPLSPHSLRCRRRRVEPCSP